MREGFFSGANLQVLSIPLLHARTRVNHSRHCNSMPVTEEAPTLSCRRGIEFP